MASKHKGRVPAGLKGTGVKRVPDKTLVGTGTKRATRMTAKKKTR